VAHGRLLCLERDAEYFVMQSNYPARAPRQPPVVTGSYRGFNVRRSDSRAAYRRIVRERRRRQEIEGA